MISKILMLFIFLSSIALFNCNPNSGNKDNRTEWLTVSETYKTYCASCHGQQLQQFKMLKTAEKDIEYLLNNIKNGNSQKGMPAFKETLSDSQVQSLAEFIQEYDYSENNVVERDDRKDYEIEVVVDGLSIPWGMAFLPNGDMLITEKKGVLYKFSEDMGLSAISGVPKVRDNGQGGLMDIILHPAYKENGWVYISYSYIDTEDSRNGNTAIIRGKLENNRLTNVEEIYRGVPASATSRHFGNRMVFDNDGYLFFSNGDRGNRDEFPQELSNSNGKIHRLLDDGSIPRDNPFVDHPKAIKSIYTYGNRNPQGLALHPITGDIWEHEHGPKGGDEINIIKKGVNYGWPIISYGINYNGTKFTDLTEKEGMEQPVHFYKPSIAPCGMAFVTSNNYPGWKNNLLIGSLSFRYLERIELNGNQIVYQEKLLEELDSRVRNVKISPDGFIYVALEDPGRIIKILPKEN